MLEIYLLMSWSRVPSPESWADILYSGKRSPLLCFEVFPMAPLPFSTAPLLTFDTLLCVWDVICAPKEVAGQRTLQSAGRTGCCFVLLVTLTVLYDLCHGKLKITRAPNFLQVSRVPFRQRRVNPKGG